MYHFKVYRAQLTGDVPTVIGKEYVIRMVVALELQDVDVQDGGSSACWAVTRGPGGFVGISSLRRGHLVR